MTATGASEGPLVYPLVVVNVEGVTCRALLDTGAGSSYASDALLSLLSKRKPRKEVRRIEMMLGAVTKQVELSNITVKALDGRFQMNVNVTKVNKRELLMLDNPNYQKLIQSYHHLKGVQMEDNDQSHSSRSISYWQQVITFASRLTNHLVSANQDNRWLRRRNLAGRSWPGARR